MNRKYNEIILADCMDIMKDMPDDYIDLAIVDPPYGIGNFNTGDPIDKRSGKRWGCSTEKKYKKIEWNNKPSGKEYFNEVRRVAKNHIIFGFQFYMEFMWNDLKGVIVHDFKDNSFNMSHADIAITNLQKRVTVFRYLWCGFKKDFKSPLDKNRIHPCEKPNSLYRWLLQNYAKPGQLILDTHSGSGSLACACHLEKFDFIAIEKDIDYHRDSVARLNELRSQGTLF